MASRKLSDLHPLVRTKAQDLLETLSLAGIDVIVTCTLRTKEEQAALYAQGRQPADEINRLRKRAGLASITSPQTYLIVTNARPGESWHQYGLAFDLCPIEAGKCVWDTSAKAWQKVGSAGVKQGLEWGGTWNKKDFPHFQYTGGLDISKVKDGQIPVSF